MLRTTAVTVGLAGAAALAVAAPALAQSYTRTQGPVVRYPDQQLTGAGAPEGASARVDSLETSSGRTIVTLRVFGMQPFAQYGAHAHVNPCGDPASDPAGTSAGGHYQRVQPPAGTSAADPAFANPRNEIWLDLSTNRAGNGRARTALDWQFEPARRPKSVIIHERSTSTADGTAGKRVACLDVPF
jgi:Cu-Zn family superoxide dismutase